MNRMLQHLEKHLVNFLWRKVFGENVLQMNLQSTFVAIMWSHGMSWMSVASAYVSIAIGVATSVTKVQDAWANAVTDVGKRSIMTVGALMVLSIAYTIAKLVAVVVCPTHILSVFHLGCSAT